MVLDFDYMLSLTRRDMLLPVPHWRAIGKEQQKRRAPAKGCKIIEKRCPLDHGWSWPAARLRVINARDLFGPRPHCFVRASKTSYMSAVPVDPTIGSIGSGIQCTTQNASKMVTTSILVCSSLQMLLVFGAVHEVLVNNDLSGLYGLK